MVDILGGMESGDSTTSFLSFKATELKFYVGDEHVEFEYLQLDPATFQSGWGIYNPTSGFEFVWDKTFGVVGDRPDETYKRAMSAWLYTDGTDRPLLWQTFKYCETSAFNKMLAAFWHEKDGTEPKLPTFQFVDAKSIQVGLGKTAEINFEFVGFKPRSAEFIIPEWAENVDVGEQASQNTVDGLSDDDLPF